MKTTLHKRKRKKRIGTVLVIGACIGTVCAVAATLLKKERHKLLKKGTEPHTPEKERSGEQDEKIKPFIPEDFSPT